MADEKDYEEEVDRGDVFIPDDEEVTELDELEDDEELEEDDEELEDEDDEEVLEEDEEDEPEEDEDDDEEEDEEDEGDEEEARIPRSRLNQVINEREAERERSAWLEEQNERLIELLTTSQGTVQEAPPAPKEPPYDFDGKEEEYAELIIDGETAKAAKLRNEITAAREKQLTEQIRAAKEEASSDAYTKAEAAREEDRFQKAIQSSIESYDFLDDASDAYDERAVTAVNAMMQGNIAGGMTKSKALQEAVAELGPLYAKKLGIKEEPKKESLGKKRTKTARKKAAKASQQQPPATKRAAKGKASRDLDTLDLAKMSESEYNKLTLRERKALRGD